MDQSIHHAAGVTCRGDGQTALTGPALALRRQIDRIIVEWAQRWSPEEYAFPLFVAARELDRLDYFRAFPHLATFPVAVSRDQQALSAFAEGETVGPDGALSLGPTAPVRHVITPAACYHVYMEFAGRKLDRPHYVTTCGTCCRHEEVFAPLERQWTFSMREVVCLGTREETDAFLETAADALTDLVAELGLAARWQAATDPFFEPRRNPAHLFQRVAPVKRELVFGDGLAIASVNRHGDHFGRAFSLRRDGRPAHSACIAFGLERWVAACLRHFGPEHKDWSWIGTPNADAA